MAGYRKSRERGIRTLKACAAEAMEQLPRIAEAAARHHIEVIAHHITARKRDTKHIQFRKQLRLLVDYWPGNGRVQSRNPLGRLAHDGYVKTIDEALELAIKEDRQTLVPQHQRGKPSVGGLG